MRVDLSVHDGVAFLAIAGEVDAATADVLREAGEKALTDFCGTLRINMAQVAFLDSSGVGALIAIRNRAYPSHLVIIEDASASVLRVLELTGLTETFGVS